MVPIPPPHRKHSAAGGPNGRPRRNIGGVLGFLAVVAIIAGTIGYFSYNAQRATNDALAGSSKVANGFIAALHGGDTNAAAALLSTSAQVDTSPKSLNDSLALIERQNGDWLTASLAYSEPRNIGGLETCKYLYNLRFEHGSGTIELILVQGYKTWRVDSVTFG